MNNAHVTLALLANNGTNIFMYVLNDNNLTNELEINAHEFFINYFVNRIDIQMYCNFFNMFKIRK